MKEQSKTPVNRNAKHTLTEDEIKQYNEQLLAALQAKKEIEAEKKEVAATYKNKIAEQELAIDKISNLMRVGYEIRPFSCYLVKNFDTGKREFYEFGSDRLVDTEPLNAGDYQLQMEEANEAIVANNEAADNLEAAGFKIVPISELPAGSVEYDEPELLGEAIIEPEEEEIAASPFDEPEEVQQEGGIETEDDPFGTDDKGDFDFDDI